MVAKKELKKVIDEAECLCSEQEVEAGIEKMASQITQQLGDTRPVVLCVMTGGVFIAGKLLPKLKMDMEFDYIHATRYNGMKGEEIKWRAIPRTDLAGRTVLLVDDILDKGITLSETIAYCKQQGAAAVYTAVLVNKKTARAGNGIEEADFIALSVEDKYVFGCGLDYHGFHRNVPGIYAVKGT